jgi:2-polyprenyl-3-methyl-5-hydroxy-6-metoxy-1,4-benzoquinol methylase
MKKNEKINFIGISFDKSLLTKVIGFSATLIYGDTLILDRWCWLKSRLPRTKNGEKLIDIGCGTGAFSIGAALRGYSCLGLTWDEREQRVANDRSKICKTNEAKFETLDVRNLDMRKDLIEQFDAALCLENTEHILNDLKLFQDISVCLKPGGRLLLTTPNFLYRAITKSDNGPFSKFEDGSHVRRGYSSAMLEELCRNSGLVTERISFCGGFLSQKITAVMRVLSKIHPLVGWTAVLPLRLLPPIFDKIITDFMRWPYFSICLEAYKPRFKKIN